MKKSTRAMHKTQKKARHQARRFRDFPVVPETFIIDLTGQPAFWNLVRSVGNWPLTGQVLSESQFEVLCRIDVATIEDHALRTAIEVVCRHYRQAYPYALLPLREGDPHA